MVTDYPSDYDGFYFFPHETEAESGIRYDFFKFNGEYAGGVKQDHSEMGDMYHILFVETDEDGNPTFNDSFDAIFVDPITYVENLHGSNLFGCIVRKTDKSKKWFEDHLTKLKEKCKLYRIRNQIDSIAKN